MRHGEEQNIDKDIHIFSLKARCALGKTIVERDVDSLAPDVLRLYRISLSIERSFDPLTYALAELFGQRVIDHRRDRPQEEKDHILSYLLALKAGSMPHEVAINMENWLAEKGMLETVECVTNSIAQVRDLAQAPRIIGASKASCHSLYDVATL